MWGSSYSGTVAKVSSNGNQTINNVAWNITSNNTSGLGQNVDGTKGAQIGTGNKPTSSLTFETSGISGTITNVTVNTSGASSVSATVGVTVGSTAFKYNNTNNTSASITSSAADYSFNGNASGTITISWSQTSSKALYVKSISVTYYPQTTITLNANGGSANKTAKYDYGQATATEFTAVTRTDYNCIGYYTASSNGTKILNANGTPAGASITVNSKAYTDSNSKWAYDGATLTLYARWEAAAASCETNPTVGNIMNAVSSITSTGATFSTSTGVSAGTNCSLEEVGFVYGTSTNPTTSNTKATITSYTSGALNKSVTGLEPNTTYYVRAYAINGHGTTYSDEKLFSTPELPKYTVSFVTGAGNSTQVDITEASANAGITLPAGPSTIKCASDGWAFAGWSATNVASETTTAPTLLAAGTKYEPSDNVTLYAVYSRTIGGSGGAPVGTTMYAENFSGFSADDVPSSTKTGNPTVYGGASVTYTSQDNGSNKTKIYDDNTVGTAKPELLIGKSGGIFTISGIPAGKATTLTLSYKRNNSVTPTVTGTGVSIGSVTSSDGVYSATITCTNQATVFNLIFTAGSSNVRFDDVSVIVASTTTAGTTYYLSTPDCCIELGSINGSVELSQKSATLSWSLQNAQNDGLDHITSWKVEYMKDGDADWTVAESSLAKATTTKTITGLTCNSDYSFRVSANVDNGYCAEAYEVSDKKTSQYTITLTGGGTVSGGTFTVKGEKVASVSACDGDNIAIEATRSTGYNFNGWTIAKAEGTVTPAAATVSTSFTMPAENVTVTAAFAAQHHNIVFHKNDGGEDETETQDFTYDVAQDLKTISTIGWTRTNYVFGGWMTTSDGSSAEKLDGASYTLNAESDVNLYALWVADNTRTISYTGDESHITYSPAKPTSVNIQSETSFSVSFTLEDHYTLSGVAVTMGGEALDASLIVFDQSSLTVSAPQGGFTDNISVTYTIAAINYTVNFYINDDETPYDTQEGVYGTTLNIPSDFSEFTDCSSFTFLGWKDGSAIDGGSSEDAPSLASVGTEISANKNYYAVFAEGTPASATWTKATTVAAGDYLIVCEDQNVAFDGSLSSNIDAGGNNKSVSISEGKLTLANADNYTVTLASVTGGYSIQTKSGYYLGSKELNNKSEEQNGMQSSDETEFVNAISITNGDVAIVGHTGPYMRCNPNTNNDVANPWFRYYKSSSYSNQKAIQFYKKNVTPANYTKYYTTCPGKVAKPSITGVTDGTTYEVDKEITISCGTANATIYYTTNNTEPTTSSTVYTDPFTLSDNGSYTIRAIAVKEGMTNSDEATAVSFTIDKPYTTIASFIEAAPATAKKLVLTGAKVLGVTANYIYIQDATAGIQLFKSNHDLIFASGKTLSGYIIGTYSNNSNSAYMPRLTFTDGSTMSVTEDEAALPDATIITAGSDAKLCQLVKLENVKFQSTSLSSNTVYVQKSDLDIDTVYNTFGVLNQTLPNSATSCDVTGVLIKYSGKYEIAPVSVDGISTNGASAILPTLSTQGSTDSENPTAVAEGKSITVTPAAGMTTTLKDGDADATTITEATNVTISEDKAIVVTAQAYYYNNNTVNTATYYYHADGSLTERTISKATMSNGTVTVKNGDTEVSSAAQGATITLIPVPTYTSTLHYHLTSISVEDEDGEDVELSGPTDGKYTFTMPEKAVTVSATFAEDAKYAITFDGNGNTGGTAPSAISNKYAGTEITLPACNYKKSGYSFSHWTVAETDSKNPVTVANNKFNMPAAAVTITAQWAALPVWATTYTSNITTVAESLVEAEDGVEYAAWKVASGSYITLDIPKGTTAIHMHMVAWNKEAANATISGTCFTSNKVVALTADAGISGSSTFSLDDNEGSEYYFSFTPDNAITSNTTIRIDAASNKRLVIFGVNAIFPEITLSPASYNFVNVRANQTKSQEFTITTNANVTGTLSASIIDDANGKYSVTAIENGKVTVTFAPGVSESGTFTAKLKVESTNASVTADLTGTAIATAAPEITVDKTAIAFGRVDANANVSADIAIGLLNIVGDVSATLSGTNADKFELSASSFSENGTLTITPKTTEQGVFAATLTLSATDVTPIEIPVSITVASKWATMYTSNVTPSGTGMESKKASINSTDYNAFKKAAANDVTITLPRGTQTLHLHMVAWNGENGNVTISGDCFSSPKVINVPAHTDVSGVKGTYTFTAAEAISYYHELVLDNVNNNGTTTVSVSKSGSRIVLFGVNQEGGVIEITQSTNISTLGDVENQPIVASGEGVVLTVNVPTTAGSIAATNGATIKITEATTASDVVVDENSKIELTATVTAPVFRICTAPGQQATSGQVTGVSHVAAESIIMDVQLLEAGYMDADYWYSISAPFDVNVAGGFMTTGGRVLIHNVDFQIWSYAPDLYANGGRSWRRCADGVMHKNAAYLIGFDPDHFDNGIVPNVVRLKAASNTVTEEPTLSLVQQTAATLKPGYAWNGVANPNVYHINVGRDVQLWDNYSHGFLPATVGNNGLLDHDSYSFVVGTPFFCKDDGTHRIAITAATHVTEYTIPNEAPARNAAERYSFCVQIRKPGSRYYENRLYVRASEDALATFEDGKDMETLNETCNGHALIWTNAYGKRLAIEDAPLTNNQAMYDLTIMTPAAGTYVLRQANEVDGADLYVTYGGQIVWNLSLGDYELDLTRGTTTGYGLLLVVQPNQMPTGVENGELLNGENGVQKILLNGNLYILRDGHLYDAVGKQAR